MGDRDAARHLQAGAWVRANVQRPGNPATKKEAYWPAHEKITVRRESAASPGSDDDAPGDELRAELRRLRGEVRRLDEEKRGLEERITALMQELESGAIVLDISDMARPRMLSRWDYHPPYPGFTHTLLPLFDPQLVIVSDEATAEAGKDWPKLVWVVDIRDETNPVPISTFPIPAVAEFGGRGGRYGAHNLHENRPVASNLVSEKLVFGTYFNGGVRVHDVSNPFQPEEVAYYVPEPPRGSRAGAVQINDVLVDERRIVYAVDRLIGGLYTLELQV